MSKLGESICVVVMVLVSALGVRSGSREKDIDAPTEIRLAGPGWWPTKGTPARDEYVGAAACAKCHADKGGNQKNTPMAHALTAADPALFHDAARTPMSFRVGSYFYEVAQTPKGASYSVSNGTQSLSVPLSWVFGNGEFGQTYIFDQNGSLYESRLSYYTSAHALDFTTGTPRSAPNRLEAALGRRMYPDEPPLCFGCHATAATTSGRFDPTHLVPGITCEACHGPGAQHVAAMNLEPDSGTPAFIMNPGRLGPVASVDFCGSCHRTPTDVALSGIKGVLSLRFPAYRLERSRCWATGDARLTCVACHDSHELRLRDAASYDKQCLSCHVVTGVASSNHDHPGAACPVGQNSCVSCHMPKFSVPEMHTSFTDHKIRIHRDGEAFTE